MRRNVGASGDECGRTGAAWHFQIGTDHGEGDACRLGRMPVGGWFDILAMDSDAGDQEAGDLGAGGPTGTVASEMVPVWGAAEPTVTDFASLPVLRREGWEFEAILGQMGGSDSPQAEEDDGQGYDTGGVVAREQGDLRTEPIYFVAIFSKIVACVTAGIMRFYQYSIRIHFSVCFWFFAFD